MSGQHEPAERVQRRVETSEYVAFLIRALHGYGARIANDPAALVHLRDLEEALRDAVNRGVFEANRSKAHYSQNEQAAILGVTRQAIAKRVRLGEAVYARLQKLRGAGAVVRLADLRARRARRLADAAVIDRTGSERERHAN